MLCNYFANSKRKLKYESCTFGKTLNLMHDQILPKDYASQKKNENKKTTKRQQRLYPIRVLVVK